jgi:hypothetical protein
VVVVVSVAEILLAVIKFATWIGSREPHVSFASLYILVKEL